MLTRLVVAALLAVCCCVPLARGLEVTAFPHYQTFDSWNDCNYVGTCYEMYCPTLQGGWYNPEFHPPVPNPPYTEEVRAWWVISGPTTSNLEPDGTPFACADVETGPCYDHTSQSGKYLYAEASGCFNFLLRVNSPTIIFTTPNATFSFWYYMFGSNLNGGSSTSGRLIAQMSLDNGTTWDILHTESGEVQTNSTQDWEFFSINLDSLFPDVASLTAPVRALFQLEARAGQYWRGDIAVDDVIFTQDGASSELEPWIDPSENGTDVRGGGGDGLSGGEIAGIVVGVVGGLGALCCCLLLLVLILLLLISPRGPGKKGSSPDVGDAGGDDL